MEELRKEYMMLRELLENRLPAGAIERRLRFCEVLEENEKLKEQIDELEKQGLRLMKRLEEYDYQFDWTDEHRKLNDEKMELKEQIDEFEEDFKPLHEYMSGMTGVLNCKDVVDYIEGLKKEIKALKKEPELGEKK